MDTTTAVVATGVVVTAGRWSEDKDIPFRIFVGFGFLAIMLAVLSSTNEKLAESFAALVLVSAALLYAVPIAKKIGAL